MKRSTWISLALAAPALALGVCAQALESDKQQPTTIDANQMTYNEKSNVNVFTGNVLLTRGSLVIRGDKLTLTERSDGTQFATVEGKPARFKQQRDSEKPNEVLLINGTGNTIESLNASLYRVWACKLFSFGKCSSCSIAKISALLTSVLRKTSLYT